MVEPCRVLQSENPLRESLYGMHGNHQLRSWKFTHFGGCSDGRTLSKRSVQPVLPFLAGRRSIAAQMLLQFGDPIVQILSVSMRALKLR